MQHISAQNHRSNKEQQPNELITDTLDDAIKEFMGVCQLYNDKLSIRDEKTTDNINELDRPDGSLDFIRNKKAETMDCSTNCDKNSNICKPNNDNIDSIDRLQKKQAELQKQLEEVLQIAEELGSKQKRKFSSILEDGEDVELDNDGEDDELIEFQQIENELRISELNRQMNNIQEELRVRLYKRLTSNMTNCSQNSRCKQTDKDQAIIRRNSNGDETSPSSSSCSDGTTRTDASSPTNRERSQASQRNPIEADELKQARARELKNGFRVPKDAPSFRLLGPRRNRDQVDFSKVSRPKIAPTEPKIELQTRIPKSVNTELDSLVENIMSEVQASTPTASKGSVSNNNHPSIAELQSKSAAIANEQLVTSNMYSAPVANCPFKNNSANSDLERIEEDEEDEQDYYVDSNQIRAIYDEKLSPILNGNQSNFRGTSCRPLVENSYTIRNQTPAHDLSRQTQASANNVSDINGLPHPNAGESEASDSLVDCNNTTIISNVSTNVTKRSAMKNRPLTLYLPKPDQELDLVEHIQTLGHDLSIVSSDLKLDSKSAHGYLWKSCSNNPKKWLKRYFHFDRSSKVLSYYDNEAQLVKKRNSSPKIIIPFEEISDVYVDHKRSGAASKGKGISSSGRGKNFIFVLATINRKYTLATHRAETMRVWIDILFTAAKMNDYFQHFDDVEDAEDTIIAQETNGSVEETSTTMLD